MTAVLAEVTRGGLVESRHRGVVVAADVTGAVVAAAGDPEQAVYFRSAAKPFQSVPLVASGATDAFGLTEEELAIACASHDATPRHQRVVARLLAKVGLDEDALRCGVAPPFEAREAARVTLGIKAESQLQCECSGEHAGMLAVCRHVGYPIDGYAAPDHPLQRLVRRIVAEVARVPADDLVLATDGCTLPTFGAPIRAFAVAYAALADPWRAPEGGGREHAGALERLRAAMVAYPELIAGDGNLDTDLMRLSGGRVVAKLGAEGLLCLAIPERGLGIAVVADDGQTRGLGPAAVAVLEQLGLADGELVASIRKRHSGAVTSFAGQIVGELRPALVLERR